MKLLVLTPPGLEALAGDELAELKPGTTAAPVGPDLPGRLRVQAPGRTDWRRLRLAAGVARWAAEFPCGDLDALRAAARQVELPELGEAANFRVTAHAESGATVPPQDAARAVGGVVHQASGLPVRLKDFELELRLDLGAERAILSVEQGRDGLGGRFPRTTNLRSSLKTTVAAGLVRLARPPRSGGALLDPTCGSGTILFEAAAWSGSLAAHGSDWDEATVGVARANLEANGVRAELKQADGRELTTAWSRRFDRVVFNPPHGVRLGRGARQDRLLADLLRSVDDVLEEGGVVVVLTPRRRALLHAAEAAGFVVDAQHELRMGDLRPTAWRLVRA